MLFFLSYPAAKRFTYDPIECNPVSQISWQLTLNLVCLQLKVLLHHYLCCQLTQSRIKTCCLRKTFLFALLISDLMKQCFESAVDGKAKGMWGRKEWWMMTKLTKLLNAPPLVHFWYSIVACAY